MTVRRNSKPGSDPGSGPAGSGPAVRGPSRRAVLGAGAGAALGAAGVLAGVGPRAYASSLAREAQNPTGAGIRAPLPGRDVFVDGVRGSDDADGRYPSPAAKGRGPLRTLEAAWSLATQDAGAAGAGAAGAAGAAGSAEPVLIWLRGGTHRRETTLHLTPYAGQRGITFAAMPDEIPIVSGAKPIQGWRSTTLQGRTAWRTTFPADADGNGPRTLYVDGARRPRPRLPKAAGRVVDETLEVDDITGVFYQPTPGVGSEAQHTFGFHGDDLRADWHNLTDVEVVSLRDWFDERAPIAAVDPTKRLCTLAFRPYPGKAWPDLFYYVENVREALTEPGEWYWDRTTTELIYLPRKGESLDTVTLTTPVVDRLISVEGTAASPMTNIRFVGITFAHTRSTLYKRVSQSASQSIGAVLFAYAASCALVDCTIRTVGEYAVEIAGGCTAVSVRSCELTDAGAGGIRIASATDTVPNSGHVITDNHIHHTGRTAHMGAGVLVMDSGGNTIAHNHIHDLFYTGVSVGWTWGFAANHAHDNRVEFNHIHDLGKGVLSDLGAIYTLGVQSGSVVRNNLLHDVRGFTTAPAAGLYPDEGSSHFLLENNVVYGARPGFHLHYGADNVVRNNIVDARGTGREAVLVSKPDRGGVGPYSLTASHNLLVVQGRPVFLGVATDAPNIASNDNLLWNLAGDLGDIDVGSPQALKIVRADDESDVPGSATTVTLTDVAEGEFAFGTLATPVTLEAGATYYLVTQVVSGGPPWYNPTPLATTPVASVGGPVYVAANGHYVFDPGAGSFGPMNLRYRTSDGVEHTWVESVTLGATLRSDYTGFLGVSVTIGSEPLQVTGIGRYRTGSWWDEWRRAGLDTRSVVADPRFVDASRHDYRVTGSSPALRSPVSYQPIDLSTVGPRA